MKKKIITRTVLTADEGMILTDGNVFGTEIILAEGDDGHRYNEITAEEYETEMSRTEEGGD